MVSSRPNPGTLLIEEHFAVDQSCVCHTILPLHPSEDTYNDHWCIADAYNTANSSSTTADQQWLNMCVRADRRDEWVADQQWLGKCSRHWFAYLVPQISLKTTQMTHAGGMGGRVGVTFEGEQQAIMRTRPLPFRPSYSSLVSVLSLYGITGGTELHQTRPQHQSQSTHRIFGSEERQTREVCALINFRHHFRQQIELGGMGCVAGCNVLQSA